MVDGRLCAGLALSVAAALACAPDAGAARYCDYRAPYAAPPACVYSASPQEALDKASAHHGTDEVVLAPRGYGLGSGLVYSDAGAADNGVFIRGSTRCVDEYRCYSTRLAGGSPGAALLSFTGGGGAYVTVKYIRLAPGDGVTALALPPDGLAQGMRVSGGANAAGIRLDGTPSRPALVRRSSVSGAPAIDAPGDGIVADTRIGGAIGARSRGDGSVEVRGGSIDAFTGVTGTRARISGTLLAFADPGQPRKGPPVGVEAACASAGAPDAQAEVTNAMLVARGHPAATGIRALGVGGDDAGCVATVRVSGTRIHGAAVSLDAQGGVGFGADPHDGVARIEASYSEFQMATTRVSGPAGLDTSSPGQNVDAGVRLFQGLLGNSYPAWSSPLVHAGRP